MGYIERTHPRDRQGAIVSTYDGQNFAHPLIDTSTYSTVTVPHELRQIHSGNHFYVQGYSDIPALNDVLDFTWQIPDTLKWVHWTWEIATESEVLWQVYEGAVVTNALSGTITPLNSNRNSSNTSVTTMKFELQADLAAANADTDVTSATLLGQGISGDGKTAGAALRHQEIIMKQNTLYCLRATAGAAGYINFDMHWHEHIDKGIIIY